MSKQRFIFLLHLYYSNYANVARGSTHKSKQIPILSQQKYASRVIFFKTKETHARPLMKDLNALNIFQTNTVYYKTFYLYSYKLITTLFRVFFKTVLFTSAENAVKT